MSFPWDDDFDPIDYDNLPEIPMNYAHAKLGYGQNNIGFFRKELLEKNIFTTFDAIKSGDRTATSRKEKYNKGDYVKFYKKGSSEVLICKVTKTSYPVDSIRKDVWSGLEGWDISYFDANPDILKKYQFTFKLIKIITDDERNSGTAI